MGWDFSSPSPACVLVFLLGAGCVVVTQVLCDEAPDVPDVNEYVPFLLFLFFFYFPASLFFFSALLRLRHENITGC